MNESLDDRVFSGEHIWLLLESETVALMGITEYAQSELGDIVYVELPEVGDEYQPHQVCAVIESVKTASDIHAPVECSIIEVNEELIDTPKMLNESPYAQGWLCRIAVLDKSSINSLMDAGQYESLVGA